MNTLLVGPSTTKLGLRLLVVDDQPEILKLIESILTGRHVASVVSTTKPRKALELLTAEQGELIDAVICDWLMPEVSGLDLLQKVRAVRPQTPFIMLTGRADSAAVLAAKDHGVTAYLVKPFNADLLIQKLTTIARIVEHRRGKGDLAVPVTAGA